MPSKLLEILKQSTLFISLDPPALGALAARMKAKRFLRGEAVYREGEEAEGLYILSTGRVRITMEGRLVSYFGRRGDVFGESSLLTGEAHSVTVEAVVDSELYCLGKYDFEAVLKEHPSISIMISKLLSQRLRVRAGKESPQVAGERVQVMAVYSPVQGSGSSVTTVNLAVALAKETGQSVLLWDVEASHRSAASLLKVPFTQEKARSLIGKTSSLTGSRLESLCVRHPSGIQVLPLQVHAEDVAPLLALLEERYRFIVVDLPPRLSAVVEKVMSQADRVVFLATAREETIQRMKSELAVLKEHHQVQDEDIRIVQVCLQEKDLEVAGRLQAALGRRISLSLTYDPDLVREFEETGEPFVIVHPSGILSQNVWRLARDLTGRKVGLALGSGTARGLAHVGVLKVLQREGILIDLVAGTSIGAYVGAIFASGRSAETAEYYAVKRFPSKWSYLTMVDLIFIKSGLMSGVRPIHYLKSIIGDPTFRELPVPLAVVATDLKTGMPVVIRDGSVLEAVRCSTAFPGVIEPFLYGGRYLLDGGLTDPVPVDVLEVMGASVKIAVDVIPTVEHRVPRQEVEILLSHFHEKARRRRSFKRLFSKIGKAAEIIRKPFIFNVVLRSVETMECRISAEGVKTADVVIRPELGDCGLFDFHRVKEIIRSGERAAEEALPAIRLALAKKGS